MTFKKFITLFLLSFSIPMYILAQDSPKQKGLEAITQEAIRAQLEFLASDWMEGRGTGMRGEFLSSDYLASMLQYMGVEPAGDETWTRPTRQQRRNGIISEEYTSYFQNIYMTQKIETNSSFTLSKLNQSYSFNQEVDYRISGPTVSKVLDSEVIFVGYGFIDKENQYDDYKGIDVNGKIIVRLEGYPGHQDTNSAGYKLFHKDERYFEYYLDKEKDKIAREKGAIAIVEILFDNNSKYWIEKKEFHKMDYNESPYPPIYEHRLSLPSNTISNNLLKIYALKKIGNKIMENHGATLADFEKSVANNLKPNSRKLKNIRLKVNYNVKTELLHTRNILGVIEGEKKDEIIVVGGHYDHLGMKNGFIWNGADDNASGTVGVWTIAKAFIASGIKPKRTIVFAGWTAEEKGLMGSKYFVNHPYGEKIENIKFYLNLDMISKDNESDTLKNQARMTYTSNIENLEDITNKHLKEHELNLDLNYRSSAKPSGGSDHTPFSMKNIPIMYFDAGYPITYHTPKDETSDVNYEKMTNIIKLAYLNLWEIVNKE